MIDEFLINIEKLQSIESPENENLFKVDRSRPPKKNKAELFHTPVARSLFL